MSVLYIKVENNKRPLLEGHVYKVPCRGLGPQSLSHFAQLFLILMMIRGKKGCTRGHFRRLRVLPLNK